MAVESAPFIEAPIAQVYTVAQKAELQVAFGNYISLLRQETRDRFPYLQEMPAGTAEAWAVELEELNIAIQAS